MDNKKYSEILKRVEALGGEDKYRLVSAIFEYLGYQNDEEWYPMDEFDTSFMNNPMDIALKIYHGNFNPYANYFKFDAYGNLVSSDYLETELSDSEIVDLIMDKNINIDKLEGWKQNV